MTTIKPRTFAARASRSRRRSNALLALALASVLISAIGCGAETLAPTGPADTTPPTAPAALMAAADGPFGVSLSWQPSTDAQGVAAYRVERCQGAGCGAFAQIATTTSTSLTDTGLVAATGYSYRVRAADGAANLSAYSNVASATTALAPLPPAVVLPAWVSALAIGQWTAIPNTSMSSVAPSTTPAGNTGPQSKVIAWTSFVVDTRTSKVYSVANGGHNDYSGNEVDVLDLEIDRPAWSQLLAPTPDAQLTNCKSYYADDRPAARHTYYGATLNEFNDRIMLFGGANWCVNGGFFSGISSYNITANSYSQSTTHGTLPNGFAGVAAYSLDPTSGDVYGFLDFNYGRWNRSLNTFTVLSPSGNGPGGSEAMSAMDTARGRILIVGQGSDHHIYTLSSNSFTSITLNGASAASVSNTFGDAMVYVAAIDRYLVRLGGPGDAVYQVHPSTFEATNFATTDGASIPSTQNGPYNKFLYVPRLQGCVYVPSYSGNAWFLRVH